MLHTSKWTVVQFHINGNNEISVVPMKWLLQDDEIWYCLWPNIQKNKIRKYIKNIILPKPDEDSPDRWTKFQIQILLKCPVSYESALKEEKRLEESEKSGMSSTDPDGEISKNKRKRKKNKMEGGFIETPSSDEDELSLLPNPPKIRKIACDSEHYEQADSDDTLSFTSSVLMPPPPIPEETPMNDNKIDGPSCSKEGERIISNVETSEGLISNEEEGINVENLEIGLKEKIDQILRQTMENRILLERVVNHLGNVPLPRNRHLEMDTVPKEPFLKYRDLLSYDHKIQESEESCSQLENLFKNCGGSNEKDAIIRGLKYLFSDKLARKCSWLGRKNNHPCQNLKTLAVLKGAVRSLFICTDKSFERIVADWLRQANLRYKRLKTKQTSNKI